MKKRKKKKTRIIFLVYLKENSNFEANKENSKFMNSLFSCQRKSQLATTTSVGKNLLKFEGEGVTSWGHGMEHYRFHIFKLLPKFRPNHSMCPSKGGPTKNERLRLLSQWAISQ